MYKGVCQNCKRKFEKVWCTKYCCAQCKVDFEKIQRLQKALSKRAPDWARNCKFCNAEFLDNRKDVKYCCSDCRVKFHDKVRREKYVAKVKLDSKTANLKRRRQQSQMLWSNTEPNDPVNRKFKPLR